MSFADKIKMYSDVKNKKHKILVREVKKCKCGKNPDFIIIEYWITELLTIKYTLVFLCTECYNKRLLDKK